MGRKKLPAIVANADGSPLRELAMGGGAEGAERTSRETFLWSPNTQSADMRINRNKDVGDARGREMVENDGYATGVIATHRDSIVGSQYRLNAQPDWETLQRVSGIKGFDEAWAEEYQRVVESRFNLLSDSNENWFDATRMNTLTGLIRLAVGGFVMTGEVLATAEWIRQSTRPFKTAIQMVAPIRLSNPDGRQDDRFLRRGVKKDSYGAPVSYFIRIAHPGEIFDPRYAEWKEVPVRKPWGRLQVIHIVEQREVDQTRGVADMVSVLKNMKMTKKFQDVTLQNAVVNASYAAAIESELPSEMVYRALGAGGNGLNPAMAEYMTALQAYVGSSQNINVDGAKIPHLFPGTKLNLKPMGTPGGVGTDFEQALLRHTAAALGLSYEQFSRDYTKTNYSSARASMAETWKFMSSRKKVVADRFATSVYVLHTEEDLSAGNLPLPAGADASIFYDPVLKEALCACNWIGASRGQIDEKKETESALLRIDGGLSTYEAECARLGDDFRKVFAQRAREKKLMESYGLEFNTKGAPAAAKEPASANNTEDDEL
jgi:lambda family phage portal protein